MLASFKPIINLQPSQTVPQEMVLLIGPGESVYKCYDNGTDALAFTETRIVVMQKSRSNSSVTSIPFSRIMSVTMYLDRRGKHSGMAFTDVSGGTMEVTFTQASDREDVYYSVYDNLLAP